MNSIYLSLGSNVGDTKYNLDQAIEALRQIATVSSVSSYHQTKPIGYSDQADFLNGAIHIQTNLSLEKFIQHIESIQKKLGKDVQFANGPRTIDIDILFWNDEIISCNDYRIPHRQLHKRSFVLDPLHQIAPEMIHPVFNQSITELRNSLLPAKRD